MLENLEAMLGHLEAMLGHVEGLGSASCGSVVGFWKLCRAIWRPCWDYVRQLVARVIVFGSYVVPLCWNSVGQLWALLAAPEGYVGPFGGYVLTMLRNLGLSWRLLKAMLDIWRLCWDYLGQLEALLLVLAGYAGAFGGHVGTTLGTSGLFWRLLKAMLGHLGAMFGKL